MNSDDIYKFCGTIFRQTEDFTILIKKLLSPNKLIRFKLPNFKKWYRKFYDC